MGIEVRKFHVTSNGKPFENPLDAGALIEEFLDGIAIALLDAQRVHDLAMDLVRSAGITLPETVAVDLVDIVMDILGVPADNTLEMIDKHGDLWHEAEELYCRDWIGDLWADTVKNGRSAESFLAMIQSEINLPGFGDEHE